MGKGTWTEENLTYYPAEKMVAYQLCTLLTGLLPKEGSADSTEYGAEMFRWQDQSAGGWKYAFAPITPGKGEGEWEPVGKLPEFELEQVGFAHTHPNNSPHSTIDRLNALGKHGFIKQRKIVYVVNRSGAFWFDGRSDLLGGDDRYGALWGDLEAYLNEVHSGKWK